MARSIGIIGGADGPTAIFVTSTFSRELLLVAAVIVITIIVFIKCKK